MTSTTMTSSTRAACPSTKVACPSTSTTMTSSVRVGPPFAVPSTGEAQALSTIIASMVVAYLEAACLVEAAVETIIGPWKRIKAEVLTLSLEATTIIKVVVAGRPPSVLGGGAHLHSQRLYRLDHRSGFHPIH